MCMPRTRDVSSLRVPLNQESGTDGWHVDILHAAGLRDDGGGVVLQEDRHIGSGTRCQAVQSFVRVQDQLVEQVDEVIACLFQASCKEKEGELVEQVEEVIVRLFFYV